jgi:hypothetical protein
VRIARLVYALWQLVRALGADSGRIERPQPRDWCIGTGSPRAAYLPAGSGTFVPLLLAARLPVGQGRRHRGRRQPRVRRRQEDKQKRDYRIEFLDWIFWWYLATIEFTDRLLARGPA